MRLGLSSNSCFLSYYLSNVSIGSGLLKRNPENKPLLGKIYLSSEVSGLEASSFNGLSYTVGDIIGLLNNPDYYGYICCPSIAAYAMIVG